jgi:hypothetical protein
MNKKLMAMALAAIGIVGGAFAQSSDTRIDATPSYLTFRGGILFPLDDNLRESSDLFGALGVDYEFPTQLIRGSTTYASLEWWFRTSNGDNGNVFPLAVNQRWYSKSGNGWYPEGRNYFFIGAGVAIIDVAGKSSGKWMLRGGVGTEIGPNIIAEAVLNFSDESSTKVRANGVGLFVGYKF